MAHIATEARAAVSSAMRAFLLNSSGDPNVPEGRVEQPAESSAPCTVDQPAEVFTSIKALTRWLDGQVEIPMTPEHQRLRAAVSVLAKTSNPRQEDVSPLCISWNVRQCVRKQRRPLATLITELQQAVLAEGNKLRRSFEAQPGASSPFSYLSVSFPFSLVFL